MKGEALKAAMLEHARTRRRITVRLDNVLPGDQPLEFKALPASAYDLHKWGTRLADGDSLAVAEFMVHKAQDEDGDRIFSDDDVEWVAPLLSAEHVASLLMQMGGRVEETVDVVEKKKENSEKTPSSDVSPRLAS